MLKRAFPFLLLCIVGALLYGHTLHVPFYLDDHFSIDRKPAVQNLGLAVSELFAKRGLSTLTFAINYRLHGFEVVGYHLANIFIHICSATVVLLLLRRVFPQRPWLPLFGALLFLAHPLQTQAVTYLVQRMTSLSAGFFLLALYLFVRARERLTAGGTVRDREHLTCYLGALAAGGMAILAKESAVVLPLALLLFAWLLRPAGTWRWLPVLRYTAPFFIAPLLAVVGYVIVPHLFGTGLDSMGASDDVRSMAGNSPVNYMVTQFKVLWIYLRMLVLPYGQAVDHAYPVSRELFSLPSLVGGIGLAALLTLAWWLRNRQPVVACGIVWFFLAQAVESSFIPLDPLFEHRLYLPMFGFAMLVTAGLERLPRPVWQLGGGVAVLLVLGVLTWQRNGVWKDPIALYQQDLRVNPQNERVMFNLGEAYRARGLWAEAEDTLKRSLKLNSKVAIIYLALKELYTAQGRLDDLIGMLNYAVEHLPDGPDKGMLSNELGMAYSKKGDIRSAIVMFRQSTAITPMVPIPYYNLAQMHTYAGEWDQVEINLRKTLTLDPNHVEARRMLNDLLGMPLGSGRPGHAPGMGR